MTLRTLLSTHTGRPTSDGAGVRLTRVFGGSGMEAFDPFLMLDEFGSENPDEYIAGFPPHPHRGFETVTYMIEGRMRHEDHMGNAGLLENGGVQWMTAARGVIHSEMPQQEAGRMRGFQLWLNLPARAKLDEPGYRDFRPEEIPWVSLDGVRIGVIAGQLRTANCEQAGAVQREDTEPHLYDLHLDAGARLAPQLPQGHRVLLYVYEGTVSLGSGETASAGQLLRLGEEGELQLSSDAGARVLLLAGKPLREPIVQYGPFVMNSREEIEQALRDFRDGRLAG
ncbi:pirin family protein [Stutzerimonas tarimensis]|uniref:Pirin family protein n=1 Tax=Stutzerimonas tarimensis TaxID=1507735 RepID=A0ABV7T808_9GAMM